MTDPLIDTWKSWKKTNSEKDLNILLGGLKPTLAAHTRKYWGANIPPIAIEIEAKSLAVNALRKYDPKRKVLLKTYVSSVLPGIKRFVDTYGKTARIPEYRVTSAGTISKALVSLRSSLDREPSIQEISEYLGWPEPRVIDVMKYVRRDLPESGFDVAMSLMQDPWQNKSMERFHLLYRSFPGAQQVATEHFLGLHGLDPKSEKEAAKISGLPISEIKGLKKRIYREMRGVRFIGR